MNLIEKVLVKLGGAHIPILKKAPADKSKYVAVGLTILFTGIFAGLSGGYAIYKVFHGSAVGQITKQNSQELGMLATLPYDAIALGLLWGLMIMNLDRFIVMSMKKRNNKLNEFLTAIPRIILAVFISLVVAKPLEVRIFQDRIDSQLVDTKRARADKRQDEILRITGKSRIDTLKAIKDREIADLEAKYNNPCPSQDCKQALSDMKESRTNYINVKAEVQPTINRAYRNIQFIKNSDQYKETYIAKDSTVQKRLTQQGRSKLIEYQATYDSNVKKREAAEENFIQKKKYYDKLNQDYKKTKESELEVARDQGKNLAEDQENAQIQGDDLNAVAEAADSIGFTNNFAAQVEALGQLTQWKEDKTDPESGEVIEKADNTMWYINLALILLFIVIETAPIFVKLITGKGPYDIAQEADENTHKTQSVLSANSIIADADYESQIFLQTLLKNQQVQLELVNQTLDDWKNIKLQELQKGQLSDDELKFFVKDILAFRALPNENQVLPRPRRSFWSFILVLFSKGRNTKSPLTPP